jgi:hypothetical protein
MAATSKITEKASVLAGQAVEKAGPALEKAKEVAVELAEKARPIVEKAAARTAHGVSAAAEQLDRATSGKYSDKLSSASSKVEQKLDRGGKKG